MDKVQRVIGVEVKAGEVNAPYVHGVDSEGKTTVTQYEALGTLPFDPDTVTQIF